MSDRSAWDLKGFGFAAAALALAGVAYLAGRTASTEVLARTNGPSLGQVSADWTGVAPSHPENLWLSRTDGAARGPRKALAIGDRVSIGKADGTGQQFEVTGVELIESDALGTPGSTIQIISGRNEGASDTPSVRFIFAIEPPTAPSPASKPEKVL